jgi:O-antigen/teichoic acid export membrane protein
MSFPQQISLKQRMLNAGLWRLAGHGISQVIRFGTNLLMTRLLAPEMFGVMAIAMIAFVGLQMLSDVGLRQSIIRSKRGDDPIFLNTAWVIQIVRGIILWAISICIALLLFLANSAGLIPHGSVYANPTLPYVIAVLSVIALLDGFNSTKLFEANRSMLLGTIIKIELAAQLVGLLFMLGWASIDRSIWALVAGTISAVMATTVLSHAWLPGTANRWHWERSAAHEITHFGKWILMSSTFGFLISNGDRLLLGGLVNPTVLGLYVIAFGIYSAIEGAVTKLISDIMFPALSEIIRERPADLKISYYRLFVATAAFVYFCAGILMVSGHTLIHLLYDPRYEQAGWMLQFLAASLLTIPFYLSATCFLALGFSRLYSNLIAIRVVTLFLLIPLGFHFFGVRGALAGIVISYFSSVPMTIVFMIKHKLFDLRKELLPLSAGPAGMLVAECFNLAVGR